MWWVDEWAEAKKLRFVSHGDKSRYVGMRYGWQRWWWRWRWDDDDDDVGKLTGIVWNLNEAKWCITIENETILGISCSSAHPAFLVSGSTPLFVVLCPAYLCRHDLLPPLGHSIDAWNDFTSFSFFHPSAVHVAHSFQTSSLRTFNLSKCFVAVARKYVLLEVFHVYFWKISSW